jgi:hypothetical protein
MNSNLQDIALRRMKKRISQYLERQRKVHPEGFSLKRIPLMSLWDRFLLIATAFLIISPLYFLRDFWWLIPVLVIPAGFFFWKGVSGTYLSIPEDFVPSEAGSIELRISDSDLAGKLTEIAATREASFFAINVLLTVFLAVLEVAAAILGALAAALGALAGG